jgi:hypothetical protein
MKADMFAPNIHIKPSSILAAFMLILLTSPLPGWCQSQAPVTVIARGVALSLDGSKSEELKKEALRDAYFRAIEQAVGIHVTATTAVKNCRDVVDVSMTNSRGYISSYREISSGRETEFYQVTIEAVVEHGAISAEESQQAYLLFNQIVMGSPRLAILASKSDQVRAEVVTIRSLFTEPLTRNGYHVLDDFYLPEGLETQAFQAQTAALPEPSVENLDCDLLLFMRLTSDGGQPMPGKLAASGLQTVNLTMTYRLVLTETGQIIQADAKMKAGPGISIEQAEHVALNKLSDDLVRELLEIIPKRIVANPLEVMLQIDDFAAVNVARLDSLLAIMPASFSAMLQPWDETQSSAQYRILMDPLSGGSNQLWRYYQSFISPNAELVSIRKHYIEVKTSH